VVNYYHDKRNQASSGCANELASKGTAGSSCQQLDSLEKLVYEVAYTGGAENLYQVLKVRAGYAYYSSTASWGMHAQPTGTCAALPP
jgi:hypothetical protein